MDQEVELAPGAVDGRENSVHGRSVGDIAGDDEACAEFVGERFDSLLDRLALVGERQFGALCGTRLGDAPGDGTVVGDAHDEPAFARHQIAGYPSSLFFGQSLAHPTRKAIAVQMRHSGNGRNRRGPEEKAIKTAGYRLAVEAPDAVAEAAGDSFGLARLFASAQQHDDVPADPALAVDKR